MSLFLAFLVYYKSPHNNVNKRYTIFGLSVAFWSVAYLFWHFSKNDSEGLFFVKFLLIGAMFVPSTFMHFVLEFLGLSKTKKYISYLYLAYFLSFLFIFIIYSKYSGYVVTGVSQKLDFKYWPTAGSLFNPFFLYFAITLLYSDALLYLNMLKADEGSIRRNQMKYILFGTFIGSIGGLTNYFLYYNIMMPPLGNILVSAYVIGIAYAIIKHQLLDIKVVIAKSFILFSVYSFVLLVVAWLWYPMQPFLQAMLGTKWFLVPLFTFAGLSMIAPFAYLHYQQKYDQRRLRRQRAQLANLKQITATSIDIDHEQLLKNIPPFLMQMYRDDFQTDIDCISVYYYEKNQDSYRLVSYKAKKSDVSLETTILKTDPIPSWFTEKAPHFAKQNLLDASYLEAFKYEDLDYYQSKQTDKDLIQAIAGLKDNMKNLKADVCVACFYKENLLAFLLMGKKQRGSYTQEELDTFSLLAHDVASNIRSGELRDELEQSYIDAIHAIITALEERDPYTKGHSERVVKYSALMAEELKDTFPFTRIFNLTDKVRRAALLHDVGKIGVPDSILLKPGKLTDEEYARLKEHPKTSLHIVQSIKNISEEIRDGIEGHHEKYDGTGYGKGAKGHHVPPIARIIAVADTFDAMTSDRPYRKAKTEKIAAEEINRVSSTQFDPKVVDAFNKAYKKDKLRKNN